MQTEIQRHSRRISPEVGWATTPHSNRSRGYSDKEALVNSRVTAPNALQTELNAKGVAARIEPDKLCKCATRARRAHKACQIAVAPTTGGSSIFTRWLSGRCPLITKVTRPDCTVLREQPQTEATCNQLQGPQGLGYNSASVVEAQQKIKTD